MAFWLSARLNTLPPLAKAPGGLTAKTPRAWAFISSFVGPRRELGGFRQLVGGDSSRAGSSSGETRARNHQGRSRRVPACAALRERTDDARGVQPAMAGTVADRAETKPDRNSRAPCARPDDPQLSAASCCRSLNSTRGSRDGKAHAALLTTRRQCRSIPPSTLRLLR